MKNKIGLLVTGSAVFASLLFSGVAFAQTTPAAWGGHMGHAPGVFGTVSAINGSTLTLNSKGFGPNATATTYTVDATNATVTKNGAASSLSNISMGDSISVQGTVSGTSVTATSIRDGMIGRMGMKPGVLGTVASVSGNSLTVTSKMGPSGGTGTTYTVDATNATVTKNGASSSVTNIIVGDTVMVQGTVSGTSVTATSIRDGMPQGGRGTAPNIIQGNGQPVIGGTVAAINSSTLTVTNKSNITYTVDATNATIEKGNATSSISNIAVGDNVVIQGTVNGTSVTASSIIDSGTSPTQSTTNTTSNPRQGGMGGFFSGIGGFFHSFFGFF
jgi:hypothetical protein